MQTQRSNQPRPIRIMLVDDHDLVREGVAALLANHSDLELVASVADGAAALQAVNCAQPDVVLLDMRMPRGDGLAVLRNLRARHPGVHVVVLSADSGDVTIRRALNEGAAGYLLKSAPGREVVEAIRRCTQGRLLPSPEVARLLGEGESYDQLSGREIDVLQRAATGQANKRIAAGLGLTENTVKNHIKSILQKLQVRDRTASVTTALRRGIIQLVGAEPEDQGASRTG
jgi:DNA-binding NarL/FixJ family response regulator